MILIGVGANLPSPRFGPPRATCEAGVAALEAADLPVAARAPWYETAPVASPPDAPWFVNGVVRLADWPPPEPLLERLHAIEADFGRARGEVNAPRVLDLDLLAWHDTVNPGPTPPVLPHPRLAERAFVLCPLADVAPGWRHPVTGSTVEAMLAALPADQAVHRAGA